MTRWTTLLVGLVAMASAPGCARAVNTAAAAQTAGPPSCRAALAPAPERTDHDRRVARLQQDSREASARSRGALEQLGYAFVARARVNNDAGDYTLARQAAECLDARFPGEASALLLKGHVLHQLHKFAEAEGVARALVARRTFVLDYGLLGDTLMEQGRLADAAAAYQQMLDLKPFYQSYTRAAHLRWLKGDLDGAIRAMRMAIATASPRDPESSAWAWTRLAAYELQSGRLAAATTAVDAALRYQPGYAAALLVEGRTLLAGRRVPEAVDALERAARANPLPEYQWTLADALRLAGRTADAESVESELVARGGAADPRTLALYLASRRRDVPTAIALAEAEQRSRADVFTLDAHAWSLAAGGRIAEALPLITRAVAEGTEDGRLFLHAGVIHAAAGERRQAREWLRRANRLRSTLLPSELLVLQTQLSRS